LLISVVALKLLCLILVANGAPVLANVLLSRHLAAPLDLGHPFLDGRPWLGTSKTFRGVAASCVGTALCAPLLGFSIATGLAVAAAAMAGDVFSSFIKRRMGAASGTSYPLLDLIPESLAPLLLLRPSYPLAWWDIVMILVGFVILSLAGSALVAALIHPPRPAR
jgi:CDP-2,3-bis-(O-geranylgeranyl)-sn-glycerol synthase